jgi:toxin ParE1/3/4
MRVRWTDIAVHQLAAACEYIALDKPSAAEKVRRQILQQVRNLGAHPQAGREGRVAGTRELVIVNTPYIVAYRIKNDAEVQVLAILHAKRRWPRTF